MSIYTQIKEAVSVPEAAERYGVTVNRNGMTLCPFHEDHNPSLMLNDDYYFCFGCHAHGDVVNFVARLMNVSQYSAAQRMLLDFRLNPKHFKSYSEEEHPDTVAENADTNIEETILDDDYDLELDFFEDIDLDVFRNEASLVENALLGYEWLLEEWKKDFVPNFPEDDWDPRYTQACQMLPTVKYLLDSLTVCNFFERYNLVQSLLEDDSILELRKFTSEELGKKYGRIATRESASEKA